MSELIEIIECEICERHYNGEHIYHLSIPDAYFGSIELSVCLDCLDKLFGEAVARKKLKFIEKCSELK